jgi:hypothetical protein
VTTPPTARRLADASADAAASLAAGAIARGLIDAEEATYRRRLQQLADQHRCSADCAPRLSKVAQSPAARCDA